MRAGDGEEPLCEVGRQSGQDLEPPGQEAVGLGVHAAHGVAVIREGGALDLGEGGDHPGMGLRLVRRGILQGGIVAGPGTEG